VFDEGAFRVAWTGAVSYDATKAVRDIPLERRDRYLRKLDFSNTRRTRGITLFMTKTMIAVAGERLPQPQEIQETFPSNRGFCFKSEGIRGQLPGNSAGFR
jgi:hypothetical protein